MHRLVCLLLSGYKIFHHLVVDTLFTGDDEIEEILAVLEPLWPRLDAFVGIEHVQDAILGVEVAICGDPSTSTRMIRVMIQ